MRARSSSVRMSRGRCGARRSGDADIGRRRASSSERVSVQLRIAVTGKWSEGKRPSARVRTIRAPCTVALVSTSTYPGACPARPRVVAAAQLAQAPEHREPHRVDVSLEGVRLHQHRAWLDHDERARGCGLFVVRVSRCREPGEARAEGSRRETEARHVDAHRNRHASRPLVEGDRPRRERASRGACRHASCARAGSCTEPPSGSPVLPACGRC